MELLALVKHDCPVCTQLMPALDAAQAAGAPLRVLSQSDAAATEGWARRLGLRRTPELDTDLLVSERHDPEAVPALLLIDAGAERGRVEGLDREGLRALAEAAGVHLDLDGLPAHRPGCASLTRDPRVAPRLAVRRARGEGRLRSRSLPVGAHEDPHEALVERGLTDGLPVVPPTPERVVALLEGTSRHPQEVVAAVPPYMAEATVEKVAVNAVMAGCTPEMLPVVLAAVEAACVPEFALHGLLATTYPAGPLVVVSGPIADRIGMNSEGNCLGQGNRANLAVGRALQLVVRNLGGGRPQVEDRAAHGQMGKLAACFAERTRDSPFAPLGVDLGFAAGDTTVTLYAAEAPRVIVDQLSRDAEDLARSLAAGLLAVAHPKLCWAFDAVLVVGPEHGRVLRRAGWDRPALQRRLHELTTRPGGEVIQGAGGCPEGMAAAYVTDPGAPFPKFLSPDRIGVVHAGGDAGLFSMIFGLWVSGALGSAPVTRRVDAWM